MWFDDAFEGTETSLPEDIAIGTLHKLHQQVSVNLSKIGLEVDYLKQMHIVPAV
jgi:hypothetical protein